MNAPSQAFRRTDMPNDHHRVWRQGHPEVIFAEDKSVEQLEGIIDALWQKGLQHTGHASERG